MAFLFNDDMTKNQIKTISVEVTIPANSANSATLTKRILKDNYGIDDIMEFACIGIVRVFKSGDTVSNKTSMGVSWNDGTYPSVSPLASGDLNVTMANPSSSAATETIESYWVKIG